MAISVSTHLEGGGRDLLQGTCPIFAKTNRNLIEGSWELPNKILERYQELFSLFSWTSFVE
jgi:hypothetical protein